MRYKSIVVTGRGGIEGVQVVEQDLRPPRAEEVRIRILATPVCQDDVAIRIGNRPFLRNPPYVPGYSFIGKVDALGQEVPELSVGDRVAALTQFGSHAEFIYCPAEQLVRVPETLDPAVAAPIILNYLVAFQILHRVARVKSGEKALVIGASGGVGTAFLQLGRLAGLTLYGLASRGKHPSLTELGTTPIDYRTQDMVEVIRRAEPGGLHYVFNGMGPEYFERGLAVLRRGGQLVAYGAPQSFGDFLRLVVKLIAYNLLPNGKRIKGYGTHREGVASFKEDWAVLFNLLEAEKIKPIIARKLPLLDAVGAYQLLQSGEVTGNLVLLAPELTDPPGSAEPD